MKVEVFGKENCTVCESTKRKLSHFIEKWGYADKAKLVFVNMDTVEGMAESAFRDVDEVPTTIISYNGSTCGRWEGATLPSEELKGAFAQCS